jgi:hypothetical protein
VDVRCVVGFVVLGVERSVVFRIAFRMLLMDVVMVQYGAKLVAVLAGESGVY